MAIKETIVLSGSVREKFTESFFKECCGILKAESKPFGFFIEVDEKSGGISGILPDFCIRNGWVTPAETVFKLLQKSGENFVTVESCTGGLVAKLMTDLPGSSSVFWGGWIVYANAAKEFLGVSSAVLSRHGAVSKDAVTALAFQGLKHSGSDWSVSISGIAGPEGGSDEKPVGTVWICTAGRRAVPQPFRFQFTGDRKAIREKAGTAAFFLLEKRISLLRY